MEDSKVRSRLKATIDEVHASLTFALGGSFPAGRGRILNAVNESCLKKSWVKTLPLF